MTWIPETSVSFLLSLILVAALRRLAHRLDILDHPNQRSSHATPTPRLGGVGIWLPTLLVSAIAVLLGRWTGGGGPFWAALAGACIVVGVGLVDDLRRSGLSPRAKYLGQSLAALLLILAARAVLLDNGAPGSLGPAVVVGLLQFVWLTGLMNFTNFMDGADGLVGGIAVIAFAAHAFLLGTQESVLAGTLILATSATLAFLLFNAPRATVFMGDSGSLFIGYLLGAAGVLLASSLSGGGEATLARAPLDWLGAMTPSILITAPIWVDAVVTLAIRAIGRQPLAQAHRGHLYQRLLDDGRSPWTVALSYWSYGCVCAVVAVAAADRPGPMATIGTVLVALGVVCVLGLHRLDLAISPFRPAGDQGVE